MTIEVVQSLEDALHEPAADVKLPDALPVLPLKETVALPNSMTPLAVGQERSVGPTTSTGSASPARSPAC